MNAPMTEHGLARTRLWERARYLLAEVLALVGLPAYLLKLRWITPAQRRQFLELIKPLESAARTLLYVELYQLPRAERRRRAVVPPPLAAASSEPREDETLPEDSSLWSVSFPLPRPSLPPAEGPGASSPRAPKLELCDAIPLAKRVEAIWRVMSDPRETLARYARRMGFDMRAALAVRPPPEEWTLAQRIMAIGKADLAALAGFNVAYDTG